MATLNALQHFSYAKSEVSVLIVLIAKVKFSEKDIIFNSQQIFTRIVAEENLLNSYMSVYKLKTSGTKLQKL